MYCFYHIIIAVQVPLFVFIVDSGFVELCLVPFIVFEENTGCLIFCLACVCLWLVDLPVFWCQNFIVL